MTNGNCCVRLRKPLYLRNITFVRSDFYTAERANVRTGYNLSGTPPKNVWHLFLHDLERSLLLSRRERQLGILGTGYSTRERTDLAYLMKSGGNRRTGYSIP